MSLEHKELQKSAVKVLEALGFSSDEIYLEYKIFSGEKELRIDAVGINRGYKVAVECGFTKADKVSELKHLFDKVILLPFGVTLIEIDKISNIIPKLEAKKAELVSLQKEVESKKRDLEEYQLTQNQLIRNENLGRFQTPILTVKDLVKQEINIPFNWSFKLETPPMIGHWYHKPLHLLNEADLAGLICWVYDLGKQIGHFEGYQINALCLTKTQLERRKKFWGLNR